MQPERRPLVVAAEPEAPVAGDGRLVAVEVHRLADGPVQGAHPLDGALQVVDLEEQVRAGAGVVAVQAARDLGGADRPAASGPALGDC